MTAEEVLAKAAELIEESWAQGDENLSYIGGPHCAGLALNKAGNHCYYAADVDHVTAQAAADQAWAAFLLEIGVASCTDVPAYNDAPGRTQIEVATALRNAKRWLTDAP